MAEHSPGPWKMVRDDTNGPYVVGRAPNFNKRSMPVYTSLPEERERRLADARLIAAAPELLAALERVYAYSFAGVEDVYDSIGVQIKAAIAKAKGLS